MPLDRIRLVAACLTGFLLSGAPPARAVPLAGANGRVVEFAGVKSAGPAGLKVQVQPGGETIDIGWDRLDLARLKTEQPLIFAAYEKAKTGQQTDLNLGTFAPATAPAPAAPTVPADIAKKAGRYVTEVGDATFVIDLPGQAAPRAVLLLAIGQDGRSLRYTSSESGGGQWADIAKRLNLAVLAYEFPTGARGTGAEVLKMAPFIAADSGSGAAVLKALEAFAADTGKAELATAPIAIYGQDVLGAAFAYNFAQTFPDRVIAAVAAKGAFYSAKPTEASAKVPLMFLWGEYDEDINLWKPTDTYQTTYEAGLALKPNWVNAMEPRTGPGPTPVSHHFALTFLDRMILARLTAEGKLQDLDGARAFAGDLDKFKIERREKGDTPLKATDTWLPDGEIAQLWEKFCTGRYELTPAGN